MSEKRRKFDQDFKDGAVDIVLTTGRPIAEVARDLGVHEGTLGNWVDKRRKAQVPGAVTEDERAELVRLRKENAELRMQRDVLKKSVVLWVDEAMGRKP
jgi:transposase